MKTRLTLGYTKDALKSLRQVAIGERSSAQRIRERIETLAEDPRPPGVRQLKDRRFENRPVFRLRCGDYRVLYAHDAAANRIEILAIGHRKDIYR